MAACPMAPRSDKCRAGSTERQEAGPGLASVRLGRPRQEGRGGAEVAAGNPGGVARDGGLRAPGQCPKLPGPLSRCCLAGRWWPRLGEKLEP